MAFSIAQISLGHDQEGFVTQATDHCNMAATLWLPSGVGLHKEKQKNESPKHSNVLGDEKKQNGSTFPTRIGTNGRSSERVVPQKNVHTRRDIYVHTED